MRRSRFFCLLLTGLLGLAPLLGQSSATQDSIRTFYNAFFDELEAEYLYGDEVDWPNIRQYIMTQALKAPTLDSAYSMSSTMFDTLRGKHLILFTENNIYGSSLTPRLTEDDLTPDLAHLYENPAEYSVKCLDGRYGYIFIPGMLLLNETQAGLDSNAQMIYDSIVALDQAHDIEGWIIDLRMNIGGDANVMSAGLYHLIGDDTVRVSLDRAGDISILSELTNGRFLQNDSLLIEVAPSISPRPGRPIAMLSSRFTASAGEFVILGMRTRDNAKVIGRSTYGLTDSNDLFELPYGNKAAITIAQGADKNGWHAQIIEPDIKMEMTSNFDDLLQDKNVIRAMQHIDETNREDH